VAAEKEMGVGMKIIMNRLHAGFWSGVVWLVTGLGLVALAQPSEDRQATFFMGESNTVPMMGMIAAE